MKNLKNIFFILCSFSMLCLTAQENDPGWLWAERGGSASSFSNSTPLYAYGEERIIDLAVDNDNNYYYLAEVAGYNFTIGDIQFDTYNDSASRRDILVFSTDEEGNYRWSKTIGGGAADNATSINIDNENNIYVSGNVFNFPNDTPVHFDTDTIMHSGSFDNGPENKAAFIIKYDSEGDYQWLLMPGDNDSPSFGNYGNAYNFKTMIDQNGIIHNLMYFKTGSHLNDQLIVEEGEIATVIVNYNVSGELIDFLTLDMHPKASGFYNYQLAYDSSLDRYYIADTRRNSYASNLGISDYGSDDNGFYLAAIDNQGEVLWYNENQTLNTYAAGDLQLDEVGNIYFSGKFSAADSFAGYEFAPEGTTVGTKNPFLVKLDPDGNLIWGTNASLYSPYPGNSIVIDGEDVYLGLGSLSNIWDDVTIPHPILVGLTPSIGIIRFNAQTGEVKEVIQDQFAMSHDGITALALDQNDDLVVGGYFGSDLFYGTDLHLHNNGADSDFFIAKYRPKEIPCIPPKTIQVQKIGETDVKIYWSPRQGETQWEVAYSNTPRNWPTSPEPNIDPVTQGIHVDIFDTPELILNNLSTTNTSGGSKYYQVFVRAVCEEGAGSWSAPLFFTINDLSEADCLAPKFVQLEQVNDHTAEISWTPVGNETQWMVSYDMIYQGAQEEVQSILVSGSPQVILENLIPETQYVVFVKAVCGDAQHSPKEGPLNFTTTEDMSLNEHSFKNLKIYPNPTSDRVNISSVSDIEAYTLFNLQGKIISQGKLTSPSIDLSNLSPGIYILNLKDKQGNRKQVKVIKK